MDDDLMIIVIIMAHFGKLHLWSVVQQIRINLELSITVERT